MTEPRVTIRVDGQDERRFSRPMTAVRFLLTLLSAEELQALKSNDIHAAWARLRQVKVETVPANSGG